MVLTNAEDKYHLNHLGLVHHPCAKHAYGCNEKCQISKYEYRSVHKQGDTLAAATLCLFPMMTPYVSMLAFDSIG